VCRYSAARSRAAISILLAAAKNRADIGAEIVGIRVVGKLVDPVRGDLGDVRERVAQRRDVTVKMVR
jgi:hypothetical protein